MSDGGNDTACDLSASGNICSSAGRNFSVNYLLKSSEYLAGTYATDMTMKNNVIKQGQGGLPPPSLHVEDSSRRMSEDGDTGDRCTSTTGDGDGDSDGELS